MRNRLSMTKISEVLRQRYELKLSLRAISASMHISISTVASYLKRARVAGITWPLLSEQTEESLYKALFLPTKYVNSAIEPDWENINAELRKQGVTLLLLWREYKNIYHDGYGYTTFCKRYQLYKKSISPTMRQIHKAGNKIFVDYAGMTIPWIDQETLEMQEAQIFVGCLGASQYTFVEATKSQKLSDWINSHVHMLEYFDGVSDIIVLDNLKSGVHKAHPYDPDLNQNYKCLSEHYNFAPIPTRIRAPKDKSKVENAVLCIERNILARLRHQTFTSITEINQAIKPLLEEFNNKPMQKMAVSRYDLYKSLDKPALKSLPPVSYEYADWQQVKVNIDYHFAYNDHFYSVPYRYIHHKIQLRITAASIECFFNNTRIAIHKKNDKCYGYSIEPDHMPSTHRAYAEWTPERIKKNMEKIGSNTLAFVDLLLTSRKMPEQAYRACLGILRLYRIYGERLEKACEIGLANGSNRYRHIAAILKNKMDLNVVTHEITTTYVKKHSNIRGSDYYK